MKCLFIGPMDQDYLASCLWDGLQEVLGEENVVDAVDSPWLHKSSCDRLCDEESMRRLSSPPILRSIGASREGRRLRKDDEGTFDLLVLNASFNRNEGWAWARAWLKWLKPGGKAAYVEGWDAPWHIYPPEMPVDAVFRKEIGHTISYPYKSHHLTFALPLRMFVESAEGARSCDVFWSGNPNSCLPGKPVRWPMLSRAFQTRKWHSSVIASRGLGWDVYWSLLRSCNLALCPSGADETDAMRTYEAAACGAIPVFVGYPGDRERDPWFSGEHCIDCTVETLPAHLDEALANDQTPKRRALLEHARKHHTTRARAEKLLEKTL